MQDRLRDIARALGDDDEHGHLDPLRARVKARTAEGGLRALQRELAEEMALSLGRAEKRIVSALDELAALEGSIAREDDPEQAARLAAEFNQTRRRALGFVRDLKIQREALGFLRHGELDRAYPIPPSKTLR